MELLSSATENFIGGTLVSMGDICFICFFNLGFFDHLAFLHGGSLSNPQCSKGSKLKSIWAKKSSIVHGGDSVKRIWHVSFVLFAMVLQC